MRSKNEKCFKTQIRQAWCDTSIANAAGRVGYEQVVECSTNSDSFCTQRIRYLLYLVPGMS